MGIKKHFRFGTSFFCRTLMTRFFDSDEFFPTKNKFDIVRFRSLFHMEQHKNFIFE